MPESFDLGISFFISRFESMQIGLHRVLFKIRQPFSEDGEEGQIFSSSLQCVVYT